MYLFLELWVGLELVLFWVAPSYVEFDWRGAIVLFSIFLYLEDRRTDASY